jgi:5-methylcytosine-specific restriction endonuclease McrA
MDSTTLIYCKECKQDLPLKCFTLRKNGKYYNRYGKLCDKCRKEKNHQKFITPEFRSNNLALKTKYNKKRFFYCRAESIIRNAKKRGDVINHSVGELTYLLASLWRKQNGLCALSGDKLDRKNSQVDHIITVKNFGETNINNFRWITKECNLLKSGLNDNDLIILVQKVYNKIVVNQ